MPATVPKIPLGGAAPPPYRVCLPGKRGRHYEWQEVPRLAIRCCSQAVPNPSSILQANPTSTGVYIMRLIVVNPKIEMVAEKPTPCRPPDDPEPSCAPRS